MSPKHALQGTRREHSGRSSLRDLGVVDQDCHRCSLPSLMRWLWSRAPVAELGR